MSKRTYKVESDSEKYSSEPEDNEYNIHDENDPFRQVYSSGGGFAFSKIKSKARIEEVEDSESDKDQQDVKF